MYPGWVGDLVITILLIWIAILSYFFWRKDRFLSQLFPEKSSQAIEASLIIRQQFNKLLDALEEVRKRESSLKNNFRSLARDGLSHMQRIAMQRYNPYGDTGGDQSFTIVILDGRLNGFLLTSLHSRSGTRVYTKKIISGKSDLELSKEEKEVLAQSMREI